MQIVKEYEGTAIQFNEDGWFNATVVAEKYGKRPIDWLKLDSTKEYIAALGEAFPEVRKFHFAKKGGTEQGTWFHPKLGVAFARWLDVRFSVWCDSQIDSILRRDVDIKRVRHECASAYKVVSNMLQLVRADEGKRTEKHHYMNEARLINYCLKGEFKSINRDELSFEDLDTLAKLQARDAVLIGRGYDYDKRKAALTAYADDMRTMKCLEVA